jgi:DNA-binding protein HU-beta
MNKGDLAAAVATRTAMSKAAAGEAVDAVFDTIADSLGNGTEVRILGFGNFAVTHRKASMGRNPQTGQPMQIKASNQAKFKPGKGLKDAVNS